MSTAGLFYYDTSNNNHLILINTVQENEEEYSSKQIKDARGILTLQNITGVSDSHLHQTILNYALPNLLYTEADLHIKTNIYGPNLSHLKGKTVRLQPPGVPNCLIPLPPNYIQRHPIINLSTNVLEVNLLKFMTTIGHKLPLVTAQVLTSKTKDKTAPLQNVLNIYKRRGFQIGINFSSSHPRTCMGHLEYSPVLFNSKSYAHLVDLHRHILD